MEASSVRDIQVLPHEEGNRGKQSNTRLQQVPHPGRNKRKGLGDMVFREGDKVMQIKNNYKHPLGAV